MKIIKIKQLFSILAFVLVVLIGWSQDNVDINKKDLIGTWVVEKLVITKKGKAPIIKEFDRGHDDCPLEVTFTNSEMIIVTYYRAYTCEQLRTQRNSYTVKGNKLIRGKGEEIEVIVKLSDNEFIT